MHKILTALRPIRQIRSLHRGAALIASTTLLLGACSGTMSLPPPQAAPISLQRISEIVASPDRSAADRTNDIRRKPEQLLAFIGPRPGMVVLDLFAAGGYTTELLARSVGPTGKVYGQSAPPRPMPAPAAPEGDSSPRAAALAASAAAAASAPRPAARTSAMALAERAKNPAAANIVAVVQPFDMPVPAEVAHGGLDLATLMFNYHDTGYMGIDRAKMNAAVFEALKPGGTYVIADHAGRPGTGISESGTLHRIDEDFLRAEVEKAGFKYVGEAGFLRNRNDPRDRNTPEPPQPKDDFVMKFVKP